MIQQSLEYVVFNRFPLFPLHTHPFVETDSGKSPVVLFLVAMLFCLPRFSKTKALIFDWPKMLSGSFLDRVLKVAAGCLPLIEALTVNMKSVPSRTFDEFASLKVLAMGKVSQYKVPEDPRYDGKISIPASVDYLFAGCRTEHSSGIGGERQTSKPYLIQVRIVPEVRSIFFSSVFPFAHR